MRIYLGHFAAPHAEKKLGISAAACNFSNNLVNGELFDKAFSILPPFVKGEQQIDEISPVNGRMLYSFWRKLPMGLSRIAPIWEQLHLFFLIPRGANLWLYNVTMLNWLLIKLLEWFKPSVGIYPIVLDYTPGAKGNDKFLRCINRCEGRISLTNYEGLSKINFRCLPGVTPTNPSLPQLKDFRPTFLLSGVMSEQISSVSNVVEAFARVPQAILRITGDLSNRPDLLKRIESIPNISVLGNLDKVDFFNLLNNDTTFILSTRDPAYPENQCNFPSKILEGLLHNRIIISTIDYPQIDGLKYFRTGNAAEKLASCLKSILSMPESELRDYANQGSKATEMFSTKVWGEAMDEIERPYDAVYLTNTPSFYKLNLAQKICERGSKMLLVFYGYGSEAVNTSLESGNDKKRWLFDWTFLNEGDSARRNKAKVFFKTLRLLKRLRYHNLLYSGWMAPEYNLISFLTPRKKNLLINESTDFEATVKGWRGWVKKLIVARMKGALPSGIPHRRLLQKLGLKGEQFITGSVGIFDKENSDFTLPLSQRVERAEQRPLRFLYVGRLIDVKNLKLLIKAFNNNGLPLTIVGQGILEQHLKSIAKPNVTFAGFIDNKELYKIYNSHHVFILPSKSEPWGLVVEEALYRGLPAIVSDKVGSGPDMVEQYNAGVLFRFDSEKSLQDAIGSMQTNYRQYAENVAAIDFKQREYDQIDAYLKAFEY